LFISISSSLCGRGRFVTLEFDLFSFHPALGSSFIPMLTPGIPGNAVMALMIGALTIHGIQPGPQIMTERPQMFWGMTEHHASMVHTGRIIVSRFPNDVTQRGNRCQKIFFEPSRHALHRGLCVKGRARA
jgi:hypothetical protein